VLDEHFIDATFYFFGGDIFFVSGHGPVMAEGVDEFSVAIAPEHVGGGHRGPSATGDGFGEGGVDVGDAEGDGDGGTAEVFGALAMIGALAAEGIAEHQDLIAELQFAVEDFSIRREETARFFEADALSVEIDGGGAVADDEMWEEGLAQVRHWSLSIGLHLIGMFDSEQIQTEFERSRGEIAE
jgi:hypothetical protein